MLNFEQDYHIVMLTSLHSNYEPIANFKACVRYFHQIFIFLPNDSPSKTMKNAFYFI